MDQQNGPRFASDWEIGAVFELCGVFEVCGVADFMCEIVLR